MRITTATAVLLSLLVALCACGGSGSSGFDVTPLSEDAVIETVLDTRQCADSGALRLCPSGGIFMSTPAPGQTPGEEREVSFDLPEGDAVSCTIAADPSSCALTFSFHVSGLPDNAIYRTAVRAGDGLGPWTVGGVAISTGGDGRAVPLSIPVAAESVQIAVLVFTGGTDFQLGVSATLADTGAELAFVSDVLAVSSLR